MSHIGEVWEIMPKNFSRLFVVPASSAAEAINAARDDLGSLWQVRAIHSRYLGDGQWEVEHKLSRKQPDEPEPLGVA